MISEVLIKDKEIRLVRLLNKCNILYRRYPRFGVYTYLINSDKGIYIFDTGPLYSGPLKKPTNNLDNYKKALLKYFPGKSVREILISHFHYDHAQLAPLLQKYIKEKFGNLPPIRLHEKDLGKKKFPFPSIDKLYKKSGYKTWTIGKPVKDGELLKGTTFYVKHFPGHTSGNIGLISDEYKVAICGWWAKKIRNPAVRLVNEIINEDNKLLKSTKNSVPNYTLYYYHPPY